MRRRLSLALLLLTTFASLEARRTTNDNTRAAGSAAPPAIAAMSLPADAAAIQVDGVLSEEIWKRAQVVTTFLQRSPNDGAPPTHQTSVRVAFDRSALYIAIEAKEEEAGKVVGLLTRRDDSSPSDWVAVL